MAKLITANKLKRFWQLGVVAKMVAKVRVLNSMEEIEANTNAENIAGAMAVAELSNNLGGYSFGETSDGKPGYRKPGADSVTPFSSVRCLYESFSYNESNTVSFENVKHGYIVFSRQWFFGHHTLTVSNNVSLINLSNQTTANPDVVALSCDYYEFMVTDEHDAIFTVTRGNRDDSKSSAHMLIVCDK